MIGSGTVFPPSAVPRHVSGHRHAALFCFLAVAWGGSYPGVEVGLEYLPPVLLSAFRYDVAAALLLGYAAVRGRSLPATRGDLAAVLATGGLVVTGGSVLLFLGQTRTTGGIAALVFSVNPILATAFARALLPDERLALPGLAGLLVGLLGVGLIVRPDPATFPGGDATGELLVLGAATSVSLGTVLVRRVPRSSPSATVTAWGMALGAVAMHALSLARGEAIALPTAPRFLAAFAYIAVVGAFGAYAVYFHLLGRIGAIRANLISYATPPVAVVAGALLLGERVVPADLVGFLAIVAGFALLERRALAGLLQGRG